MLLLLLLFSNIHCVGLVLFAVNCVVCRTVKQLFLVRGRKEWRGGELRGGHAALPRKADTVFPNMKQQQRTVDIFG